MRQVLAAAVLATAALAARAQTAEPPPAPTAEAGRQAYTSFCVRCHGINLAVTGSAFYDLRTFPKDDKPRFLESVSKGKRAMPAWGGIVRPDQMESIWLYIGQVNGW